VLRVREKIQKDEEKAGASGGESNEKRE